MALSESEELELLQLQKAKAMAMAGATPDNGSPDMSGSFPEIRNLAASDKSLGGKAWGALNIPAEMSKRGLQEVRDLVKPDQEVTGHLPRDIAMNTPAIVANTLSQVAPKFIDRASILTAGAAKAAKGVMPLLGALRQGIGSQAAQITGAAPGAVNAAFDDASLLFSKGKKAASPLYEAAKAELPAGTNIFGKLYKPEQIVDTAQEYMAKGGTLEPSEALTYRKALDKLISSKRVVPDALYDMKKEADAIAKSSENIAAADPMHQRGVYAESLRNLFPQNKYGGASAFKLGLMGLLEGMGTPGKVAGMMMSPLAAGVTATGAGLASRAAAPIITNPGAAVTAKNAIQAATSQASQPNAPDMQVQNIRDFIQRMLEKTKKR